MNLLYYREADQSVGPFLPEALIKLYQAGLIFEATEIRADGSSQWFPLKDVIRDLDPEAAAVSSSTPASPDEEDQYYYLDASGEQRGPLPLNELLPLIRCGQVSPNAPIACAGDVRWRSASELLSNERHAELMPPSPPAARSTDPLDHFRSASRAKVVSGLVAVGLSILTIGGVVSCRTAEHKLKILTSGSDPDEVPRMFADTVRGISQDDPFRALAGLFERKDAAVKEAEDARLGAWILFMAAGAAGGYFYFIHRSKQDTPFHLRGGSPP